MGLWILALVLICLIWGGSFALSLVDINVPLWTRIVATFLVVLAVVGVIVFRKLRARARAQALEKEILRQSEQQAAMARPDRRGEIMALHRQVQQGIESLKQTKVGKSHGRSALYVLPWYAIIGPPGAGKTTALRHSGLVFPFMGGSGGGVRGVGGTRNCDWWFTNDGILLDTAGRYATEEDDREEWMAFLGMLRKYRPKQPINGLLVAIAISDLIEATDEQLQNFAGQLRARVDEIMTRLDVVLPVYLVFTKADLIGGFAEFFGDLRKSERDQILGATLPLDPPADTDAGQLFSAQFGTLVSTMHARSIQAMAREWRPELRAKIFQFPLEFKALAPNLEQFVRTLFLRNAFQENPIFRGFYFTSGTQEGRPFDRVLGGMARAFGLRPPQAQQAPTEPKSYFVTDLFRRVVFPDQGLANRTANELRRQRLVRAGIAAGALIGGTLIAVPALVAFFKNRGLIGSTESIAVAAQDVNWTAAGPLKAKVDRLDETRLRLRQLDDWNENGAPASYRWGMYEGSTLYPPLRDAYVRSLNDGLAKPAKHDLESRLQHLGALRTVPGSQYVGYYRLLKLYLMMTEVARLDVDWATPRLTDVWAEALNAPNDQAKQAMLPHTRYYLELIKRGEVPGWQANSQIINRARSVLLRAPQIERLYEILIRDANANIAPIRRERIFYGSIAPFVTSKHDKQVDGAYTREGWQRVRELLGAQRSKLADERWVLGEEGEKADAEIKKEIGKLKDLYFERYKRAWRDFILDLEVDRPKDATKSLEQLTALSEPEWPYQRLLRILAENARLEMNPKKEEGFIEKAVDKAKVKVSSSVGIDAGAGKPPEREISPVEAAFQPMIEFGVPAEEKDAAPTKLSEYQGTLAKLVGVLTDLKEADANPDTKAVQDEFQEAFRSTSALLTRQDGFTRPMMTPLLMRPITGSWLGVVNDAGGAASALWEVSVWEKWHESLEPYYPFNDSPKDAKLADFTEFFKPKSGLLWAFYNENLGNSIKQVGENFEPKRRFNSSANYVADFLGNCLKRGAEITGDTFAGSAEAPSVEFQVNLHSVSENVSEIHVEIDGKAHVYRNTPEEWLQAAWPAPEAEAHGARVRIRGFSGLDEEIIREGDFGFFRLLDAATKIEQGRAGGKPDGPPTMVATWELPTEKTFFKLDIRPKREDVSLSSALFRGYRCPRVIATAGD